MQTPLPLPAQPFWRFVTTANSKASATKQTTQQAQPAPPSPAQHKPPTTPNATGNVVGERRIRERARQGACTAVGCKADLTSTTSLSAPPLAPPGTPPSVRPWCPAWWRTCLVGHVPASVLPCVVARRRTSLRPALALAFILGHVVSFTAPLPFACGSSSLVHRHSAVSNVTSGDSRPISGDASGSWSIVMSPSSAPSVGQKNSDVR